MAKRTVLPACSLRTASQSTLRIQSFFGSHSSSLSPSLYCSRYSFFTMLPTLILASTSAGFGSACALARRMLTSGTAPVPTARAAPTAAVDFSSERRVIRPCLVIGIRWSSLGFGLCRSIRASPQASGGQDQSAMKQRMCVGEAFRDARRQRTKRRLSVRAACPFLPGHSPVLSRDRRSWNLCTKQHSDAQMFRNDALQQGLAPQKHGFLCASSSRERRYCRDAATRGPSAT